MRRGQDDTVDPWLFCLCVLLVITPTFHFQLWLAYFENFVCWAMSYQFDLYLRIEIFSGSLPSPSVYEYLWYQVLFLSMWWNVWQKAVEWQEGLFCSIVQRSVVHCCEQKGFTFSTQQELESANAHVTLTWFSLYPKLKGQCCWQFSSLFLTYLIPLERPL